MATKKQKTSISRREYEWLMQFKTHTSVEKENIALYEASQPKSTPLITPKRSKVNTQVVITKSLLWRCFLPCYKIVAGKEFIQTPETLANIAPLVEYFARDSNFKTRDRLLMQLGHQQLRPNLNKGLLIIGGYGNGKTTIMETFATLFDHYQMPMKFSSYKAHDLVTEYERLGADPTFLESSKYQFYERLSKVKGLYLDDVKKEREASNYGKVNLIRDILEKRYDHKNSTTYITCNYRDGAPCEDPEDALAEFGEKYGGHIYDRLFEMFNIILFKGKTFR